MANAVEVTELLHRLQTGDKEAESRLFYLVYDDLKRVAAAYMRRERADHTLQPTALVNEAWLHLGGAAKQKWISRSHFLAVAAHTMRHILVDHARRRHALRRGGEADSIPLDDRLAGSLDYGTTVEVLDLERALERLEQLDPRQARIVTFRYYGGMTEDEIAEVLDVSLRTVKRDWRIARAWLFGELRGTPDTPTTTTLDPT